MNSNLDKLPASALRTMIINETRKFILALEYGSTLSDLQEIKEFISRLEELLAKKEKEEKQLMNIENLPQVDIRSINGFGQIDR